MQYSSSQCSISRNISDLQIVIITKKAIMRQINYIKEDVFCFTLDQAEALFFISVGKVRPLSVALVGKPVIIYQLKYKLPFSSHALF